ncbi:MAG: oxygenase MpaB family protein [Ferruginibacter sp.]
MDKPVEYFFEENSIVRKIWGKSDTILFIFAGAAAEFALNKAVDWLYHTGKLPADPIGRLFSTVTYARQIVFSELDHANAAIDKITAIHAVVEKSRNATIPDWAYRDVLFMLIWYSIAAFELLERKLNEEEKEQLFDVFYRMGKRMHLKGLPENYKAWLVMHDEQLQTNLVKSDLSTDLFKQYKKHLGTFRYKLLLESQKMVVPQTVKELLGFNNTNWLRGILWFYKLSRKIKLDGVLKSIILPPAYSVQVKALDS